MNLTCDKCKLASSCPERGSSPLKTSKGKTLFCRLIGNYGREPVEKDILSVESLKRCEEHGFCTSYIEIPKEDGPSKKIYTQTTIVFHEPILHEREKQRVDIINRNYRRTHKI